MRFGLFRFRSPLLSESLLFSLPVGTEMFHFPTFPPHALYIQAWVTGHDSSWVSPFGHPRITARLPTPQGLSQAPTSFFGSRCQGIHHVPFVACLTNTQRRQHSSSSRSNKNSYCCYKDRSLELPANRRTCSERPKTRHPMVKGCREDARVHYEGINVQARRAAPALSRRDVLVGG